MTEEEAKTKVCHKSIEGYRPSKNTEYGVKMEVAATLCLGTDCMAWLWSDPEMETIEYLFMGGVPDGDGWVCVMRDEGRESMRYKSKWERKNPSRNGCCGLAGKS